MLQTGAASVHPSAIVENGAKIGAGCQIGPFCHVGPNVVLEDGVELKSHVAIAGDTQIGPGTRIWPFASIGHQPQDLKYAGEATQLRIGSNCMIRESVSINLGTVGGGGLTKIGDNCLFMLASHVGHDCSIGNNVIVANSVAIGGHVTIGDGAVIGGLSGIHQFCRIGQGAMIGGMAGVVSDIIPYATIMGDRPNLAGLNLVGLKRLGVDKGDINKLRAGYKQLFQSGGSLRERAEQMMEEGTASVLLNEVLEFILTESDRSFTAPKASD